MIRAMGAALAICLAGIAGLGAAAIEDQRQAALSYLVAFSIALAIPLGTLGWSMICDACGAVWFVPLRRVAESISACLIAVPVLFIPVLLSMPSLYPWTHPGTVAHAGANDVVNAYLTPVGFTVRAPICMLCWILIAELMRRSSLASDRSGAPDRTGRRRALAALGLMPLAITVTIASIDWFLSLDPSWHSSVYGLLYLSAAGTAGMASLIIVFRCLSRSEAMVPQPGPDHVHALGTLLFVSIVMWAYLAYMQLLVIWMADLPDEAGWYAVRLNGRWGWMGLLALILQFAIPFPLLLVRNVKRSLPRLTAIAVMVLAGHAISQSWQLTPALTPALFPVHWPDIAACAAVMGAMAAFGIWRSRRIDVMARHDPDFGEGMLYRIQS